MMRSRAWAVGAGLAVTMGVASVAMSYRGIDDAVSDDALGFTTERVALRVEGMT